MSVPEPDHFHQVASLVTDPAQHDHDVTRAASPSRWRASARDGGQPRRWVGKIVSHAGVIDGGVTPDPRRSSRVTQLKPFRTHRRIRPV